MAKPRVIVADTDESYLLSIQLKFIEDFFEKIDLEIITDREYFNQIFSKLQKADVLIVSEDLYNVSLQKHNISHIFLMTEQYEEDGTEDLEVYRIFKYTSIKEIFNEILNKSADVLQIEEKRKNDPQIVVVYSASGGTGKTMVALGLCNSLSKNYKKVLYIDAEHIHTFQYFLSNSSSISSNDIYAKLARNGEDIYQEIKHVIRTENFAYIPPFKAPLISLGIMMEMYLKLIAGAKKSLDFDYIVVDTDSAFDEVKGKLIDLADRVVVVTNQSRNVVYKTNTLLSYVNGIKDDKYIFICNDFDKNKENMLISPEMNVDFNINHYIEHIDNMKTRKLEYYAEISDIQKMALLFM
jgi:cellulose biosynthesis protein BcsQ